LETCFRFVAIEEEEEHEEWEGFASEVPEAGIFLFL